MKILITGICGFAGSTLASALLESRTGLEIWGLDNFIRPGSETNRERLTRQGARVRHGDIRQPADLEAIPPVDWVIDAAANPSVLAGVDGRTSSRQLLEHNLYGTVNLLEYCKEHRSGFILLSTSRVYSIEPLSRLSVAVQNRAYQPDPARSSPAGMTAAGIAEDFSTAPPISLYGSTKLASESLALEYSATFGFPVWINRCGVLAGAGQFGRPDQGIFAYWINSYLRGRPLRYIGFDGQGHQVRDCLHPRDLAPLLLQQMQKSPRDTPRVLNVSGGIDSACSLRRLSDWCAERFGPQPVSSDPTPRPFDLPWVVLDSFKAERTWGWKPQMKLEAILDEIARHAEAHPGWLELSAP